MSKLIELRHVSKIYGAGSKIAALNHISLHFDPGEFTAIAGPSGSGKSTLLNLIGALDTPTEGEILYEGNDISELSAAELADFRLGRLGFIFQSYNLIPVLTAIENVEYPLMLQGIDKHEAHKRSLEALDAVGLKGYSNRRPDNLSGGQQQRVAVARAIVSRPKVVLADEPTANLDSKTAASLLELMADLNSQHNVTFIFSSHDPAVLSRAKRIIELHDGKLLKEQPS